MFAYEPLRGYRDDRDAVELPWEDWAQEASARGRGVADLFSDVLSADRSEPPPQGG